MVCIPFSCLSCLDQSSCSTYPDDLREHFLRFCGTHAVASTAKVKPRIAESFMMCAYVCSIDFLAVVY